MADIPDFWGNSNPDGWDEEDDWERSPEKNKMEIAKDVMDLLENDQEVMDNFNFLLRQKKLKQLKNR